MNKGVDVSHRTVIFVTAFLLIIWILYQIRDVILLFFVAIIFMSALSPIVDLFKKLKVPTSLGIAVTYIFILGLISLLIALTVTPLIEQTSTLAVVLPHSIAQLLPSDLIDRSILQKELTNISKDALTFTLTIFSNVVGFISVVVLTFYLLLDKDRFKRLLAQLFVHHEERAIRVIEKVEDKLGAWLRGQIFLSLIIGTMSYFLLWFLGIPYALPLAILAGLLEVIPVIGPIISAVPAVFLAYLVSPTTAVFVAFGYLAIQQLENNLIVPQVMRRAVGLNPLVVIFAIAVGGRLLGIGGALLAVPITVVIQLIAQEVLNKQNPVPSGTGRSL